MKNEGQMRTLPPLTHPGGHRQPGDSDVMLFVVGGHLILFVTRQHGLFVTRQAPSWQLVSALLCGIGSSVGTRRGRQVWSAGRRCWGMCRRGDGIAREESNRPSSSHNFKRSRS